VIVYHVQQGQSGAGKRSLTGACKANDIYEDSGNVCSICPGVNAVEVVVPRRLRRIIKVGHAVVSLADEIVLGNLVSWF